MRTEANIQQDKRNTGEIPALPWRFSVRRFAKEIGISHTTVYAVINGEEWVSEETRAVIIEKLRSVANEPAPAA